MPPFLCSAIVGVLFALFNLGVHAAADIAHFDLYADSDTLHLLIGHGKKGDPGIALFHRRSSDGGTTWSAPVRVNAETDRLSAHHPGENPSVAASGDRVIVAWTGPRPNARRGGLITTMVSADAGKTWQRGPAPFEQDIGSQTFMRLAAAGSAVHMMWLDSRERRQSVRYARSGDFGKTWSTDLQLAPRACECCWNSIAVGPRDDGVAILYRGENPRDMMAMSSADGKQWTSAASVGNFGWQINACPHVGGALTRAGDTLHALAWTGKDERWGVYHSASKLGTSAWSPPQRIGADSAKHADLALAIDGALVAVWDEPARTTLVKTARLAPGATSWSAPQQLGTIASGAAYPRVAVTRHGTAVLWFDGQPWQGAKLMINGRELQ